MQTGKVQLFVVALNMILWKLKPRSSFILGAGPLVALCSVVFNHSSQIFTHSLLIPTPISSDFLT